MTNEPPVTAGPEPVDQLADEFLGRFRQGERPSITDYVQAHPDLASEIRELFPTLVLLERLGPRQEEVAGSRAGAELPCAVPQNLGEYRILREVGRGGMGVVYEAEHLPLGRHVALKVLPSSAVLNPGVLTRFQNEVRAAARLHHTNIVPVFGVGEDQGTHYYAMQFIAGQGLDVVLAELRRQRGHEATALTEPGAASQAARSSSTSHGASLAEYFRSVARMGLQVAEALVHAHSQGVLHRDIKPSNLLLDAQGCVWVTDFGLAKQAGCDVTNTGDVVGTLRYLAPERFRGTSDARTDIYGLGITLYELLTTQPAFATTDRVKLVHEIAHSEPLPLRRLERRLPRDLETIVLKAMAKEPAERYATAADLAADLRRFLDDKPIGARRLSLGERLWRWCVRRPALASLAAALLLSLTIGVGSVFWQWLRAETNLQEAVRQQGIAGRQRAIAEQEATRAEDNYQAARQSVNELLTLVSEDDLMNQPGLQPVRLRLLTKALEFHEKILAERAEDPAARRDLALGYLRVGLLKQQMGPAAEVADAYRRAIELLETAAADGSGDREAAILLVRSLNAAALHQIDQHNESFARDALAQARQRIDRLLAESQDAAAEQASAQTFNNEAYLLSQLRELEPRSRMEESLRMHEQALAIYRRLAERQPGDLLLQLSISTTLSNMARRQTSLGQGAAARRSLEECLAIRLELARQRPQSLTVQHYLAAAHNKLGDIVLYSPDRTDDSVATAAADYEQAAAIQERLTRNNPAVLLYWQEFASTLENLSRLYRQANEPQRALDWQRRETEALRSCLNLDPENMELRSRLATQLEGQATLEAGLGLYAQSLATRMQGREAWRPIQEKPAALEKYGAPLRLHLARLMVELGMQDRPAELLVVAKERRALIDGSPSALFAHASALHKAARAAARGSDPDAPAQAAINQCEQLVLNLFREAASAAPGQTRDLAQRQSHMRSFAALVPLDADLAKTPDDVALLIRRSRFLQLLGDASGAQADWQRAMQLVDAVLAESPTDMLALRERAKLYYDVGRWEQAVADCDRVLRQRRGHVNSLEYRARAAAHLGRWQQVHGDLKRVLAAQPKLIEYWPLRCQAAYEAGRVDEAQADAARLVELAGQNVQQVETLIWGLLAAEQVPRFPKASLALAERCRELATQATHRRPLGGVYFQLGRYQEAVDGDLSGEIDRPGETAAFAAFWLAMSHHHLGQHDRARQMFETGVRNWKGATALTISRSDYLRATWLQAKALLFGSETPAARS